MLDVPVMKCTERRACVVAPGAAQRRRARLRCACLRDQAGEGRCSIVYMRIHNMTYLLNGVPRRRRCAVQEARGHAQGTESVERKCSVSSTRGEPLCAVEAGLVFAAVIFVRDGGGQNDVHGDVPGEAVLADRHEKRTWLCLTWTSDPIVYEHTRSGMVGMIAHYL